MSQHDDLTSTLSHELEERAHAMDGSALHLADVRGRARSIRRRRTAGAVAGVAAAVAVIVPVAALATRGGATPEPAPATHSVSPTPTGDEPAPGVLDVSGLPTGAAPHIDHLQDGTLHFADGSTAEVRTRYTPGQFVDMADGARVWSTTDDQGRSYVEIEDTDGTYHDPVRARSGLSVNGPHSIVAWLTTTGQVMIWEGWASQPRPLGDPVPGSDLRLGPVTGAGGAVEGQAGPDCGQSTCTVIVNVQDRTSQPWEVGESGSQPLRDGSYLVVEDVSGSGLSIGYRRLTDFGSCSTLLGGGEFQGFSTCKHTLVSFSPDERLILADPAYHDGIGNGVIGMYDLRGHLLFTRHSTAEAQSFYPAAVWEDATHVLAPVFQDGTWSIVRISSDGSMEYAVPPVPGEDTDSPFLLATGGAPPA